MATIPFRINSFDKSTVIVKNNRRGLMRFENVSMQVSQHSAFTGAFFTITVISSEQGSAQVKEIIHEYEVENKATRRIASNFYSIQKIDYIYIQPGEAVKFSCFALLTPQTETPPLISNWQITGFFDDQYLVLTESSDDNSAIIDNKE